MRQIYAEAFAFVKGSAFSLCLFAALLEAALYLLPSSSTGGMWAGLTFLAYAMHRYFLFGELLVFKSNKTAPKMKFGLFFLFSVGALIFVLSAIFALGISGLDSGRDFSVGTALVWGFVVAWLLSGVLGTLLPWSVDRNQRYALRNGIKTAPVTLIRLLLGPALVMVAVFAVIIAIELNMPPRPVVVELVMESFYRFLSFIPMVLTAGVLCKSYEAALANAPQAA